MNSGASRVTPPSSPAPRAPSRELDALIAEEVMGYWDVGEYEGRLVHGENNMNGWPMDTPHYSTDMTAAMEVVEKLRADGWWFSLTQDNEGIWDVCFWQGESRGWFPRVEAGAHESGAPLSICLAALAAVSPPRAPLEGE